MCVRLMTPGISSGAVKAGTYVDVWYHSSRTLDFKKEMQELLHEDSLANIPQDIELDSLLQIIEVIDNEETEKYEDEF